jgi:hypothetical protein
MLELVTTTVAIIVALPYFWLLFVSLAVLTSAFVVNEKGFYSTVTTAALLVFLVAKWDAIAVHPLLAIPVAVAYLAVGLLWARFQWARLLSSKFEYFQKLQTQFLTERKIPLDYFKTSEFLKESAYPANDTTLGAATDQATAAECETGTDARMATNTATIVLEGYIEYVTKIFGRNNIDYCPAEPTLGHFHAALAPKASKYKGSIVMWITYWPISSVWYISKDVVLNFNRWLYNLVAGRFQKMAVEKFAQL